MVTVELLAASVHLDPEETQALVELLESMAHQVRMATQAREEDRGQREVVEAEALLELAAYQGTEDSTVYLVYQEKLERLVLQENQDPEERLDHEVQVGSQDRQVPLEHEEREELMDFLAREVKTETLVSLEGMETQAHQAFPERGDLWVPRDRRVQEAAREVPDPEEIEVCQAKEESREYQVLGEIQETEESLEKLGLRDHKESQAFLARLEFLGDQVYQEERGLQEDREILDRLAHLVIVGTLVE